MRGDDRNQDRHLLKAVNTRRARDFFQPLPDGLLVNLRVLAIGGKFFAIRFLLLLQNTQILVYYRTSPVLDESTTKFFETPLSP